MEIHQIIINTRVTPPCLQVVPVSVKLCLGIYVVTGCLALRIHVGLYVGMEKWLEMRNVIRIILDALIVLYNQDGSAGVVQI